MISRVVALLAGLFLTAAVGLSYAQGAVFDADGFAARVDRSLRTEAVSAEVARRVTDQAIGARPDLVAVRPLIESAAQGIVRGDAFRALVRGAARDVHRSAFDRDAGTVTLTLSDVGLLVIEALEHVRPDLAAQVPSGLRVQLAATSGDLDRAALRASEIAERSRTFAWVALAAALVLGLVAVFVSPSRRVGVQRVGVAVAVCGAVAAVASALAPAAVSDTPAGQAVLETWAEPLSAWFVGLAALGAIAALAAASALPPVVGWLRTALRTSWARTLWPFAALGFGAALVLWPRTVLDIAAIAGGLSLGFAGIAELLRRAGLSTPERAGDETAGEEAHAEAQAAGGAAGRQARPAGAGAAADAEAQAAGGAAGRQARPAGAGAQAAGDAAGRQARPAGAAARRGARLPRRGRVVAVAAGLAAAVLGVTAVANGRGVSVPLSGRCNGSAALCDRPLDAVAFVGTHNSMAAEGEPGWLFAAQNAGIDAQLEEGVRALLIDTHYGFSTPRGVATDIARQSKSRAKIVEEVGERFVDTAERLRDRIGYQGGGTSAVFLCHAFCEVGATDAVAALTGVHRYLVEHPEEVLILSIEDDTSAEDTARVIRDSGLIREVYRGPVEPPWPTLREMIERNERVLVLIENEPGPEPWMHSQAAVSQETPFHFGTAAELAADECRPNRGGRAGSLLLVNHWVDTSPAPRPTIAREVNQRAFLEARLEHCREQRRPFPTVLAVDFYRDGDTLSTVGRLNGRVIPTG